MSRGRPPAVVGAGSAAAFVDAPGVGLDDVLDTAGRALAGMPAGGVLTVYTDHPAAEVEVPPWCATQGIELIAVVGHERRGTTLVLRRPADPAVPDAPKT